MNLPNSLTIFRILLIPVFLILLLYGRRQEAFGVFLAAGITDALDGLSARLLGQRTKLGAYLDPVADKLLLATAFVVLGAKGELPLWLTVVVIARDLLILLGFAILVMASCRPVAQPTPLSKATTVSQVVLVALVLAREILPSLMPLDPYLIGLVAALTCVSGLQYIYLGTKILEEGG